MYTRPLMGSYDSLCFHSRRVIATNDKDYSRLGSAVSHYSDGAGTNQIILASPDIADGTGAGKDSPMQEPYMSSTLLALIRANNFA